MPLTSLLSPKSIAIVGASARQGSFGHTLYRNLRDSGFQGVLYPVNPNRRYIETVPTVPNLAELPEPVDLAILIVPAPYVTDLVRQGVEAGKVRSVLVLAGGFRESGAQGAKYEEELKKIVQDASVPLVGPNCVGIINTDPSVQMHAMFVNRPIPAKGGIAFISQSGAVCISILDEARSRGIGFSKFVSIGNKADVDELQLLEYLGDDPNTRVILMYIEELTDGQRFIEIARKITLDKQKPIIALKSGRSPQGARAARSHTGSLAGSDAAYEAILRQSGVLRVNTMNELFDYASAFELQPLLKGNRIAVVTNSGGPGIIAIDALVSSGLEVAELSDTTKQRLKEILPPHAAVQNPCDLTGDADEITYSKSLQIILEDENVDGTLVILTPVTKGASTRIANAVAPVATATDKTTVFSFMGVSDFSGGVAVLNEAGLPHYTFPENAVRALSKMPYYREILEISKNKEIPHFDVEQEKVETLLAQHLSSLKGDESKLLNQHESDAIFAAYGLPTLQNRLATSLEEVATLFEELKAPLAMKVMSPDVVHKSDVGGVMLGISTLEEAQAAYEKIIEAVHSHLPNARIDGILMEEMAGEGVEVIVGGHRDEKFGSMIMFGLGGRMVEVWKDVTFRMAPMWRVSAERMVSQIRGYKLLEGVRGMPPSDVDAAVDAILRLSQLMTEHPEIQSFDINPLILYARGKGAAVADGRMIISRPKK